MTSPHSGIGAGFSVARHSDSVEATAVMKRWTNQCINGEDHKACNGDDRAMPTRVLDISGDVPRLFETNATMGRYATLSYCWGSQPQLILLASRLWEYRTSGVPVAELPQTPLDAINICKPLGISYLWIDALCIVQDSVSDWEKESARMCDVYSNAYLTIASAAADSSASPIFRVQTYGSLPYQLSLPFQDTTVHVREVGEKVLSEHLWAPLATPDLERVFPRVERGKSWTSRGNNLPLCERAWTVQKRVLSRRVLYFTPDELWWECGLGTQYKSERPDDGSTETDENQWNDTASNRGALEWLRNCDRSDLLTLHGAYKGWADIVRLFTAGNLTYAKDKLPSLSGLAQRFRAVMEERFGVRDEYLAGLWRGNLAMELLWTMKYEDSCPMPRPSENNIPTWSWASVNGVVQFPGRVGQLRWEPRFCILDCYVDLATNDLTGQVAGGSLVIKTLVSHGHMVREPLPEREERAYLAMAGRGHDLDFPIDTSDAVVYGEYSCVYAADTQQLGEHGPTMIIGPAYYHIFWVLKKSVNVEGAFERVGSRDSHLKWEKELWTGAQIENITIV